MLANSLLSLSKGFAKVHKSVLKPAKLLQGERTTLTRKFSTNKNDIPEAEISNKNNEEFISKMPPPPKHEQMEDDFNPDNLNLNMNMKTQVPPPKDPEVVISEKATGLIRRTEKKMLLTSLVLCFLVFLFPTFLH